MMMIPAGRLQDKFGPRIVASIGAFLTGVGLIVTGFQSPGASFQPSLVLASWQAQGSVLDMPLPRLPQ